MSTHFHGDWSNHDWTRGAMDIASMARDGIEGGFHKLGDGLNFYVDPYFPEAARRMRSSSFKFWGAYHVLWGNRDINAQADWHISLMDSNAPGWRDDPRFRVMSDDEKFQYNVAPSPAQINQYHDRWLARCPWLSGDQFAYAPDWVYGGSQGQIRYPVVASNYGANPAVHYPAGYPGNQSSRWNVAGNHVLQYGSLLIQGTQSTTDVNAVRDDAVWAGLIGEDMGERVYQFRVTDGDSHNILPASTGAIYVGTRSGWYHVRNPADLTGLTQSIQQNGGVLIQVGDITFASAQVAFGPYLPWSLEDPGAAFKGDKGDTGDVGPKGDTGPKGDAAVLQPGTVLLVETS